MQTSHSGKAKCKELGLSWPSAEAPFLAALFKGLERAGVRYCVLRNYQSLPDSLDGSDLDLLAVEGSFQRAIEVVRETVVAFGGRCISAYEVVGAVIRCYCGRVSGCWWGAQVDLYRDISYEGVDTYDATTVVERAECVRGVRVASCTDASLIAFLKECLANGSARKNYTEQAAKAYAKELEYCRGMLARHFGRGLVARLDVYLTGGADGKRLAGLFGWARRGLFLRAMCRNPLWALRRKVAVWLRRVSRLVRCPGVAIAILGCDGSGKSTLIEAIQPILDRAVHGKVVRRHLRPNLLPSLARLFGRTSEVGPVTEPHRSSPSGFWGSLARLAYYTLDYVLGYWLRVYPALVKRSCVYLFDRYFYDFLVDPRRARIALPRRVIHLFSLVVPKPDVMLCVGAEPSVIHGRKPELPRSEVQRQLSEWQAFCRRTPGAVWIDTGGSIDDSADRALEVITTRMAARYEKAR